MKIRITDRTRNCFQGTIVARGTVAALFITLALCSSAASVSRLDSLSLNAGELMLRQPLSSSAATSEELRTLATQFSSRLRQDTSFDQTFVQQVSRFVTNNRSDTAALTAKLYLALYLTLSSREYAGDDAALHQLQSAAGGLYSDIASNFPGTWQGKLASVYNSEMFLAAQEGNKPMLIGRARQALPVLTSIEKEAGFIEFQKVVGSGESVELSIRSQIIKWCLDLGDLQAAQEELGMIKQKYPESKALKRLERRIAEARNAVRKP